MAATEGTNRPDSNTQAAAQTGAGQSPVVHLAQAATPPSHTTASIGNGNPNVVHVTPPGAGEREDITVLPGQTVVLDGIDIETAHVERVEGGLLITLADGGIIFLAGFVEAAGSGHPPVVEIPGLGDLAATQLLAASDSSTDNSLADIQPAAGPGGLGGVAHGGGADFETVNAGSIGSGLTPQGLLGPTDFTRTPPGPEFGLGSPQTNNTETPTTPTTPPPTITAGEAPGLAVDESNLTAATNNGIDGSTPNLALTSETTAFAGVFTASGGTTTYALSINGGNGTASGFTDAQTHQGIVLVDNGGTIEGHVGATDGQLAFTIAVDGSGNVTLTQDRAVVQADGTSPDTSEGASLASGLVHLTATVTDTGGTASASVDLNVSFLDDGPSISPADVEHAGFLVDESALPSGAQPSLAGTTDTENFAGAFTAHVGADGGATAYALSITGGNGTDSGLVDSASGNHVFLFLESGSIVAREGTDQTAAASGSEVFSLAVNATTGDVTMTLDRAVHEDSASNTPNDGINLGSGLVGLTATVTDNDGDTSSASIDIGGSILIFDDGPTISLADVTAPTFTVDESALPGGAQTPSAGASDTHSFAGAFSGAAGADGGSTAYSLSVTGGNGTDSGLVDSASGNHVFLFLESGSIVAREGTDSTAAASGSEVFSLAVNATTGDVTMTLDRAVHEDGASNTPNDGVQLASGLVGLTATLTDNDGDQASASIDIGQTITILDDGPTSSVADVQIPTFTVDESALAGGVQTPTAGASDTESFADVFSGQAGADGLQSATYSLSITGSNGTDSGLIDSASGNHVFLFLESGSVVAREGTDSAAAAGGSEVFSLAVDGSGNVTMTLDRAVHEDGALNTPDDGVQLASGLVNLTGTVTDNDGDTASSTIDLGSAITILDDGPSVSVADVTTPTFTVDESALAGGAQTSSAGTTDTENFAGAFNVHAGADGQQSLAYSLSITGGSGTDSGLIDSQSGNHVFLFLESGSVVAREGTDSTTAATGSEVFSLAVNATTGDVTMTLDRAVHEDGASNTPDDGVQLASNLVNLTATVTDNDGDTSSASIDLGGSITILDDGPSIAVADVTTPTFTVDESALPGGAQTHTFGATDTENFAGVFTAHVGADGGATAYALSITGGNGTDSGLVDSASGNHVFLFLESGSIVAREGTDSTAAATGSEVFSLGVNSTTGDVTMTLDRAVHEDGASNTPNDGTHLASGLVNLTGTVTDNDGDTSSASIDLGSQVTILDDGPSISASGSAPTFTVDESALPGGAQTPTATTTDTENFAGAFTVHAGADGQQSLAYALSVTGGNGTDSGLIDSASGNHVFLFLESGSVVAREGTDSTAAASGSEVFSLAVNATTGGVTMTLDRAVHEDGASNTPNDGVHLASNLVNLTATVTDGDSDQASQTIDLGSQITILDDGPSISANQGFTAPTFNVDESALSGGSGQAPLGSTTDSHSFAGAFTVNAGADGQQSLAYALSITGGNGTDSGLIDSATGNHVFLFLESGEIVAREGTDQTAAIGGSEVFTMDVNATGSVSVTLDRAVHEGTVDTGADSNEAVSLASNLVNLTATVTDNDGDSASQSIDLGSHIAIHDDGPTFTTIEDAIVGNMSNTTVTGTHDLAFGADGEAASGIDITALTTPTGVTYESVVHNPDGSSTLIGDLSGQKFFELDVNPDGTYDFSLIAARVPTTESFDLTNISAGKSVATFTLTGTNDNPTFNEVGGTLLNLSTQGFGVDNNGVQNNESFNITFPTPVDSVTFGANHTGNGTGTFTWVASEGGTVVDSGVSNTLSSDGTFTITPSGEFDSITLTMTATGSYAAKLTTFSYSEISPIPDETLQFQISGTDHDGDISGSQILDVSLLANNELTLSGGQSLDLTNQTTSHLDSIDMATDTTANTVTLNANDVLNSDSHTLNISGGATDTVNLSGNWHDAGVSGAVHNYTSTDAVTPVTVAVDTHITQVHVQTIV